MRKRPKHRLRHVPPGPCGIWFQATQAKKKQKRQDKKTGGDEAPSSSNGSSMHAKTTSLPPANHVPRPLDSYEMTQLAYSQEKALSPEDNRDSSSSRRQLETHTPSAWQLMQQDTNVTTPYNPTPWTTLMDPQDRYEVIRSNLPDHYITLWEILRGDCDMKLQPQQRLRVLVHAVELSHHHNIWTVDLRDDTGASMWAWIEPRFIQEQLQTNGVDENNELSMIRPGVVWILYNVSMMIVPSNMASAIMPSASSSSRSNDSGERLERMLLVSGRNIEKIWYPNEAANNEKDEEILHKDSPENESHDRSDPDHRDEVIATQPWSTVGIDADPLKRNRYAGRQALDKATSNHSATADIPNKTTVDTEALYCQIRGTIPLTTRDTNCIDNSRPGGRLVIQKGNEMSSRQEQVGISTKGQEERQWEEKRSQSSLKTSTVIDPQDIQAMQRQSQENNAAASLRSTLPSFDGPESNFHNSVNGENDEDGKGNFGVQTDMSSTFQTSNLKSQKKKHSHTPLRPTRASMMSPSTQNSRNCLSPHKSPRITMNPKKSPRRVITGGTLWDAPDSFILEMLELQERKDRNVSPQSKRSTKNHHKKSMPSSERQPENPSVISHRTETDIGSLFEPSSWSKAAIDALEDLFSI